MTLLQRLRWLRGIINDTRAKKYKSLWQIRRGFYNDTVLIDGITKRNQHEYISDREYWERHPYNNAYSGIIDNKLYLPFLLNECKELLPKTFFFKDSSGLLQMNGGEIGGELTGRQDVMEILSLLEDFGQLVLKHTHSSIGDGFHLVEYSGGEFYLDKQKTKKENLLHFVEGLNEYLIQEYIHQADYSERIYPASVNTIRFQCVWDEESKSFFVARSFHRFGSNGQIVDNVGAGNGLLVYIDTETGVLKNEGVERREGKKKYFCNQGPVCHPDSGVRLDGFKIPNYLKIKEEVIKISNRISFLRWIGWDVVVTEDGFRIIEANSLTTLDTIQQRSGFLADDRIRKVLKR